MIIIIPTYILGLLQRFGPQHGYQIKKLFVEQLSDFTQVKLPTIYYHLDKMAADNLIIGTSEKTSSRPEKTIYAITDKGVAAFNKKLNGLLDFDYHPTFPSDGAFYFSDSLNIEDLTKHLKDYIIKLQAQLATAKKHENEILRIVPDEMRTIVWVIFRHQEYHYKAELDWAISTMKSLC